MKQRIFIAINLPKSIKNKLVKIQKKLPGRKTPLENLHITLQFLGYLEKSQIKKLKDLVKRAGEGQKRFQINLIKVYSVQSRMLWAEAEENLILDNLAKKFANHRFNAHITLARGKISKFCKNINLSFTAKSIDIMQSKLLPKGAKYAKLWEYKLK